jgi:hypothetical protein
MDHEAAAAANTPLSDEPLQNAPANAATQGAAAPNQAIPPVNAAPAASAPAKDPTAGGNEPQDPVAQPQEPAQKKGGVQKRIDELTRERYEAERRAQHWEQQARQAAQVAQSAQQQPEKPPPKIEDFQDINSFFQARDAWVEERAVARLRQEQAQERQQHQSQQQHDAATVQVLQQAERFKASEAEVAEKYPDYHEAVQTPVMQQLKAARPDITRTVIDSPHGPEVVYFLGKNPQAAIALAQMTPFAAAREIGRIEQMFMQPKGQSTSAPPPVRTVGGNAVAERSLEKMGNKEYREWRESQRKRK